MIAVVLQRLLISKATFMLLIYQIVEMSFLVL